MTQLPPAGDTMLETAPPPQAVRSKLEVDEIAGLQTIGARGEEWRELCIAAECPYPFYRPEFITANLRAFYPRERTSLLTASTDGKLAAVLPLVARWGRFCGLPARQLQAAANVHSCRFDILRRRGPEGDAAVAALWVHLRERRDWDILLLTLVPADNGGAQLAALAQRDGHRVKRWEYCEYPYIPLTGEGEEPWLKPLSGQFRNLVRRRTRQLEAEGTLRLVRADAADEALLRQFYELEAGGWKGKEGTAIQCQADTRQFYYEVAREAARHGYFSLYLLYLNDRLIAGSFGFEYDGRYLYLKPAYDEEYKSRAPGHVLIYRALQDCRRRGLVEFDFCGSAKEYMLKWSSQVRPIQQYCIFQDSLYGRLLYRLRIQGIAWAKRMLGRAPRASEAEAGTEC